MILEASEGKLCILGGGGVAMCLSYLPIYQYSNMAQRLSGNF